MKSVVSLKEGVAWGNRKLTERASRKTANEKLCNPPPKTP